MTAQENLRKACENMMASYNGNLYYYTRVRHALDSLNTKRQIPINGRLLRFNQWHMISNVYFTKEFHTTGLPYLFRYCMTTNHLTVSQGCNSNIIFNIVVDTVAKLEIAYSLFDIDESFVIPGYNNKTGL